MVGLARFLLLCTVVLMLPTLANSGPAAPSGLSVQTNDSYGLWLSWADNSVGESGFEITDGETVREVGPQTNFYRWGAMKAGQYKCFRVRAYQDVSGFNGEIVRSYSDWEPNVSPWYRCGTTAADPPRGAQRHESELYAGYGFTGSVTRAEYVQVNAIWWVPRVECPPVWDLPHLSQRLYSRAAPWVGLSGNPSSPNTLLIQIGTVAKCDNGNVSYNTWGGYVWQGGGATFKEFDSFIVEENDQVSGGVSYEGSNTFTVWIHNFSKNKSAQATRTIQSATPENSRSWGLCIVELAPYTVTDTVLGPVKSKGGLAKFTTPIEMMSCGAFEGRPVPPPILHRWDIALDYNRTPLTTAKTATDPYDTTGSFTVEWRDW
jgi:hypothetical protein